MRLVTLVKRIHEEYGNEGFQYLGRDWQEPGNGMTLAHDILEHFPKDTGTMEEEMMALGAGLFVRNDDYFGNMPPYSGDFAVNFASDFPNFCMYFENDGRTGQRLKYPGITRYLSDDLEEGLERLKDCVFQEVGYGDDPIPPWVKNFNDIKGWMRKGYRKAQRRYTHMIRRGGLPWMFFIDLEEAINEALEKTETGERVIVGIDIARYQIDIRYPERNW